MNIFDQTELGRLTVKNRVVRSATYEGLCDTNGNPLPEYGELYEKIAAGECGTIITGFTYITRQGRAVQPLQAGIDRGDCIDAYRRVTEKVHTHGGKILLQIAHTGRQTLSRCTGMSVVGVSNRAARYFREKPQPLTREAIKKIEAQFVDAAWRAQQAGFDGVQLHAAHGYLIHQFLMPSVNIRRDEYGVDLADGMGLFFLERIIDGIRQRCDNRFALLVKVSGGEDGVVFSHKRFKHLISFLDLKHVDGIEISYGSMENALSIFRGASIPLDDILDHDPVYRQKIRLFRFLWKYGAAPVLARRIRTFTPMYNLSYAEMAKQLTTVPIISVGGFRTGEDLRHAIASGKTDFVSMCRPFIAEPDIVRSMNRDVNYRSLCRNCNRCAVTTGSAVPTRCLCSTT